MVIMKLEHEVIHPRYAMLRPINAAYQRLLIVYDNTAHKTFMIPAAF